MGACTKYVRIWSAIFTKPFKSIRICSVLCYEGGGGKSRKIAYVFFARFLRRVTAITLSMGTFLFLGGGLEFVTEPYTVKGICRVLRYERWEGVKNSQFLRYVIKERSLRNAYGPTKEKNLHMIFLIFCQNFTCS
jgi:hypothetical protein